MSGIPVAVLAAGPGGTTAESFIRATCGDPEPRPDGLVDPDGFDKQFPVAAATRLRVVAVVFNNSPKPDRKPGSHIADRVAALNGKYGLEIPTLHVSNVTHPDTGGSPPGFMSAAAAAEIDRVLNDLGVRHLACLGFGKRVVAPLISAPVRTSSNNHPARTDKRSLRGLYGIDAHKETDRLRRGGQISTTAVTIHSLTSEYDDGEPIGIIPVRLMPTDTAESIEDRVRACERYGTPGVIGTHVVRLWSNS